MPIFEPGHTPWDVVAVGLLLCWFVWDRWDKRRAKHREEKKQEEIKLREEAKQEEEAKKHEENKALIAEVIHELKPNSGKSLADAVNRIEAKQQELIGAQVEITKDFKEHIAYTQPHVEWIEKEMDYERYYVGALRRSKRRRKHER